VALGLGATASGGSNASTAVGSRSAASGNGSVALGHNASASGIVGIAIGGSGGPTQASGSRNPIAIGGENCRATGLRSIALGSSFLSFTDATATDAIAIGGAAVAAHATAVVLGAGAATDAANQIMLGTASEHVKQPGGQLVRVRTDTGTTVTVAVTDYVVLCNGTGGNQTVNLPAGVAGQTFRIKNIHATASATLTPDGTETIDGAATLVLDEQHESVDLVSDGSDWWVV
jgi:hypothetical protein